jgi:hypothetical protein
MFFFAFFKIITQKKSFFSVKLMLKLKRECYKVKKNKK